ncbi:alpha/beta fold hydrolase [Pontivivens ytuae]|uniref:Alpha/beta hydrolase n=1 Tax=Pontivivens ytuae TaxID=2789856 RepID=A0A7S9LSW5_9RHOB|nr:alpha/beta hydrolase [Pontivivens ytuae]QPH54105.1 alpha/beta hydrolase [Pontivivens ytuae]
MADTDLPSSGASKAELNSDLIHLIYDTAIDNSLWPETVLRIYEAFEEGEVAPDALHDLQVHFAKGLQISERIVRLQERGDLQDRLMRSLALRVELFGHDGRRIDTLGHAEAVPKLDGPRDPAPEHGFFFGPDRVRELGLPPEVASARISFTQGVEGMAAAVAHDLSLRPSQRALLESFLRHANLRRAADEQNLSYETARTYFKAICLEAGVSGQAELLRMLVLNPALMLRGDRAAEPASQIRRLIQRPDGGQIEVFVLGREDAYPIVHLDALSGGALDLLAYPERYLPLLDRIGARLVLPCRPGMFGSSFRPMTGALDHAEEVQLVCDAMGIDRFSLLSYSYGSVAALGAAAGLQKRVDRVVLASVCYPDFVAPDWRDRDFFYQVSQMIGRRWPGLLRRVIPFVTKSILQNIDNYADQAAARAKCPHEEAILMSPDIRPRSRAMLEERIAGGMDGIVQEYRIVAQPLDFDLSELTVPLHLFHGAEDRVNPLEGARALARKAARAELTELPGRGHAFIYAEWDWLLCAAAGVPYRIPPPDRRGILTKAQ